MFYFVINFFPFEVWENLGVDFGSELVPVDLVTEWTLDDVTAAIFVG